MYNGLLRAVELTLMFLPGTIIPPLLLAVLIDGCGPGARCSRCCCR
jgi:hypothetical protein